MSEGSQGDRDYHRALVESLDQGVAVYRAVDSGRDFVFVDFNSAAQKVGRVDRAELIGRRVSEAFPGVEDLGLLDVLKHVWETGEATTLPATKYTDGRVSTWVKNRVYRLPDGLVVAVFEDVTVIEQERMAREESERRYRMLTESTMDGVWDWDLEAGTLYLSPKWKEQLGYLDNQLVNEFETWDQRLHPDDKPRVMTHLENYLGAPVGLWIEQFRLRHKNGRYVWTMARGVPIVDDTGKVVRILGVHINIDDQKKLEESITREISERKKAQEELTERNAELSGTMQKLVTALEEVNSLRKQEKESIYRATVYSMQHIVNNLLNELTLVEMEIEKTPSFNKHVAEDFNRMKVQAQELVEKLSSVTTIEAEDIRRSVRPS